MIRKIVVLVCLLMLANCATVADDYSAVIAASQPPSPSIRSQIVRDARDYLVDPYSVRDAEISNVATFSDGSQGVCVKANARNRMGGYSGRQTLAITIHNGVLSGNIPNHPLCQRPDVPWRPFPELEALAQL